MGLVDGMDRTGRSRIGPSSSCTPDGWPFSAPTSFRLLAQRQVQPFIDTNTGPALSSAMSLVASWYWMLFV
jgi:hypothetical protein